MIPFWSDIAFAKAMTPIEKIVLSRTLKHVPENTTIVNNDPDGWIRRLKQTPGKKIAFSSTSMLLRLLELGLIDELLLVVHPILVGENKRLFDKSVFPEKRNFKLEYSVPFKSGAIALHYLKIEKDQADQ